jgi:hypothetical protein
MSRSSGRKKRKRDIRRKHQRHEPAETATLICAVCTDPGPVSFTAGARVSHKSTTASQWLCEDCWTNVLGLMRSSELAATEAIAQLVTAVSIERLLRNVLEE